ncbi:flavohemoglobin expression-modulating QEGLA motif protein [Pseudohongiella nitratireducens]|uniref:flavohemoglobin expression-modulating QEGLA motif protein n=1 Tax=Pseudohongiella nitratireducens TaxID=1768907 RepID=UPI002409FDF2|nr:flavohemoglobin expression-modulating QEGLA motif protein [Pseudohongiella nitratireducens]MDF1623175.1 flavohemoglobin expression-modulating QEGLA motif protein [Pseudohongiella nitratireducens]
MAVNEYQQQVKVLSDQLLELQRPIRILDAIKWPSEVEKTFFKDKGRELPRLPENHYQNQELGFDPVQQRDRFLHLRRETRRKLGRSDGLGGILCRTIDQYLLVIDMLANRGTPEFGRYSRALYGSARDHLRGDRKTLRQLGEKLGEIFSMPGAAHLVRPYEKNISATDAVDILQDRLGNYFDPGDIRVILSDGIVSDAAAGGDYIKINQDASFTEFDLQVLEVHEGWVHVGTTLNGRQQPWATWLSVGSPRVTACQEGLAVLMETLTFSSYPGRALKVSDRVVAVDMAEQGADFLDVYHFFTNRGLPPADSYKITQRVFRGGTLSGGSVFSKDLSYLRGFVENVNFIRSAIQSGVPEILPMLFVGKITLDDIPILYQHYLEGTITGPHYIPEMFRDLNGLYVWFGFASGMSVINMGRVQRHFQTLFAKMPKVAPLYEKVIDSAVD